MADDAPLEAKRELYRELPQDFVNARARLTRQLRGEGRRDEATAVSRLRRPSLTAWAANRLHEQAPKEIEDLLEAGRELREAMERALTGAELTPAELRGYNTRLSRLVDRLTRVARNLLREAGHGASEEAARRIASTLRAAATDADASRQLAQGVLGTDLEPAGFGSLETVGMVPEAAGATARERREREAEIRRREAAARLASAEREAERAEKQATRMREWAEELSRHAGELFEQARAARARAQRAQREAEGAEGHAREAREAAEKLRETA
jgi:hypothetical protein